MNRVMTAKTGRAAALSLVAEASGRDYEHLRQRVAAVVRTSGREDEHLHQRVDAAVMRTAAAMRTL
jgi:hypothetical protein